MFGTLMRKLNPPADKRYRDLLVAFVDGQDVESDDVERQLGDRTPEKFEADISIVRSRKACVDDMARANELIAQADAKKREREAAIAEVKEIEELTGVSLAEVRRRIEAANRKAVLAFDAWRMLRSQGLLLRNQAIFHLHKTASKSIQDRIDGLNGEIGFKQHEAAKVSLTQAEQKLKASAQRMSAELPDRIASCKVRLDALASGTPERGEASMELTLLKAQLRQAVTIVKSFEERQKQADNISSEIAKLEAAINEAADSFLDWKNFQL